MTVQELLSKLCQFPPESEVAGTYEGVVNKISEDNIYSSRDGVVFIDVDDNFYRDKFENNEIRNPQGFLKSAGDFS